MPKPKELTPAQVTALHELANSDRISCRINGNAGKALAARGYATASKAYYGATPYYTITDAGRAAHDAIFTAEKRAADEAAAQAERDARVRAAQEKRARFQQMADERNAATTELLSLLPSDFKLQYGLTEEAKVHNDGSGVYGGETWGRITNVEILAIVKAALAEAQR